jgi:hypothetical protein
MLGLAEYKAVLRTHSAPSTLVGVWQLSSTLFLFFALWFTACYSVAVS